MAAFDYGSSDERRWPHRVLVGLSILLCTILIAGVAVFAYVKLEFGRVTKLDLGSVLRGDSGSKQPMNVLLVGSDSRAQLDPSEAQQFGSSQAITGQRSDTIMVLHVDPGAQRAAILSLPRDLWVPIAGTDGKQRINTAFDSTTDGPRRLIQTIQQNFNIPIDHYAAVNFDGFKSIVAALGGVQIPFAAPARDTVSGLNVPRAGCVVLSGDQALAYVRSRHYEAYESGRWRADPRSDLSRIDRQQDFIRRVIRKAVSKSTNPLTLNSLTSSTVKNVTIDKGFSLTDITRLANRFHSLDPNQVQMMTLPTTSAVVGGADVLLPSQPGAIQTIDQFLNTARPATSGAVPPIPTGSISLRVLNGSGTPGQATDTAGGLKDAGFVVSGVGDAKSAGNVASTIEYATGEKAKADVLAHYVGGDVQEVETATLQGVDAILVTGQSFTGITGTSPTTAAAGATTTTTTVPAKAPSAFVPSQGTIC